MKVVKHIIYIFFIASVVSCNDYLDIEPVGKVIPKTVEDYRSFLTQAYAISKNHKELFAYRADELQIEKNTQGVEQYEDIFIWNDESPSPSTRAFSYSPFYTTIFYTNHIINSAVKIEGNIEAKNQLVGEAYALRAMQYFELINIYAKTYSKTTASSDVGVPIVTEYNADGEYQVKPLQEVYDLILSDIEKAESLINVTQQELGKNYRFSLIALKSFKSRVFLYKKEWQKAIDTAKSALAIKSALVDLNIDNSKMPSEYNSIESILALDIVSSFDISSYAKISSDLINSYDKINDLRFSIYFNESNGSYTAIKNANSKYKCSYRTAELYLTIAEALTQLNKITEAKSKLIEFVKTRYKSSEINTIETTINSLNKNDLLNEVLEERRREFAIEGHRWIDLKRTTQPIIIKTYDGNTYTLKQNDERYVIPFPKDAKINNPNL